MVSPQPQSALRSTKPIELQKLDKVPKVGSIENKWYCVHCVLNESGLHLLNHGYSSGQF